MTATQGYETIVTLFSQPVVEHPLVLVDNNIFVLSHLNCMNGLNVLNQK